MKKITFFIYAVFAIFSAQTQTMDSKWNIGIHAGVSQYSGDIANDFYKTDKDNYGVGAISISRYLSEHFALDFITHKGRIGISRPAASFRSSFTSGIINLRYNFAKASSADLNPYIFAGVGGILFDKNIDLSKENLDKKLDFAAPSFGAGINIKLNSFLNFNLQETFIYSNRDDRDGIVAGDKMDCYLFHTAGINFNLGKGKDTDKDGVPDNRDKCPGTPPNIPVDKNGCPLDKDGDGVADYLDVCPDVAGLAAFQGCPDRDKDGIADKDDQCPDVAGTVALKGCPDKDGDGIADKDDRCPDVAGAMAMKGCPDTDKDGVPDIDDKCPNTKTGYKVDANGCPLDNDKDGLVNEEDRCPDAAGPVSLKGCPDSDGDGVADIEDRCPHVKGTIANKGCPEMTKEDVKKITQIASKIFFETNSDKLKVASLVQLDELAAILKRNEGANLTIEGHTDDRGADDFNMNLSHKRTQSVVKYLVSKGISESRLTGMGYGETRPIADNKTTLGRAKNRRVELKTSY